MQRRARNIEAPVAVALRAHVWMAASDFFTREGARPFCWLWMLGSDGRVFALRVPAALQGDQDAATALLVRFAAEPDLPVPDGHSFGPAVPLRAAPIVPMPRWHVSFGHPLQVALRAFAARLDADVLAALGALEVPGPFFGSVANYNRFAVLPAPIRRHRLQALAEFPPLVAPLLLDGYGRPDMFGADEDEPEQPAAVDAGGASVVLHAMDCGRDLVGALAAFHGIGRSLVRSAMLREAWADGGVPHDVLKLLDRLPPPARPGTRAEVEERLPQLRALPVQIHGDADVARLAATFARGWQRTWRALDGRADASASFLRDTRDFLRAALEHPAAAHAPLLLYVKRLGLAWISRRGIASLLDASLRWHAQPLVRPPGQDAGAPLPERLLPILGDADTDAGCVMGDGHTARELLTAESLYAEGEAMHHCVGDYWRECTTRGARILHLALADGETATAEYRPARQGGDPTFQLQQLRGAYNAEPSGQARRLAHAVKRALNAPALRDRRIAAARAADAARTRMRATVTAAPRTLRMLDRRSQHELRLVLAWCGRQADWQALTPVLLRGVIRGFEHAEGPRVFPQLAAGDPLDLVREPDNPHDDRAVRIDWRGHKLGYVAREDNPGIARRMDAGIALAASITAVARRATGWSVVEFAIMVLP